MEPIRFDKWEGEGGCREYILEQTGCTPFTGVGIWITRSKKTALLRSVDDTPYYDDDLSDIHTPKYTLFGHNGDQDVAEKRYNEPLLNADKTEHIYLYRVSKNGKKTVWWWYGKYKIVGRVSKPHPGKDLIMRTIVVLDLIRV